MKTHFTHIYRSQIWNNKDPNVPLSGPGSSIQNTTKIVSFLNDIIDKYDIKSVIDLGCGDCTWIPTTNAFNTNYLGIDIVVDITDINKKKYGSSKFIKGDITEMEIPKGDLFIIRDVIFLLSDGNILKLFNNIKDKFKYILISSCNNYYNRKIFDDWFVSQVNIMIHPYKKYNYISKIIENGANVLLFNHDNFYVNNNEELIEDTILFKEHLIKLNEKILDKLKECNVPKVLLGNLFYDHLEENFYEKTPSNFSIEKRIRLTKAANLSTNMFEIGVNGGHSALLALLSNDKLTYMGNDIMKFYPPEPLTHPEIYVKVAIDYLKNNFGNRVNFIIGDCLTEIPKYVDLIMKDYPTFQIDLLHIDGGKDSYETDFMNMIPILKKGALIIFDDSNMYTINSMINNLIKNGYLIPDVEFPEMDELYKFRNSVVRYTGKSKNIGSIPKIIHQIWVGPNKIPDKCEIYRQEIIKIHPDWTYKLWTDKDVTPFNFSNYDYIMNTDVYAQKADIMRYEILYKYGGVYFDTDFKLYKSLDTLINFNKELIICNEVDENVEYMSIGFIMSKPYLNLLKKCADNIKNVDFKLPINQATGPWYFGGILKYNLNKNKDILMLKTNVMYPIHYNNKELCEGFIPLNNTIGIHVWDKSW